MRWGAELPKNVDEHTQKDKDAPSTTENSIKPISGLKVIAQQLSGKITYSPAIMVNIS